MSESCQDGNCHGNNEFGADESPTKLIVNYIPEVMTQDMMFSLFSTMGKLESCKLIANRGYGFVEYSRPEDAIKARKAFNGLLMQNKTLKVSHALLNPELKPPSKPEADWNLYVCNLPNELTLQDLHGLFAQFGKIVNSRIAAGIAFVLFEQQYEAERALQSINGTTPPGFLHPLTVKYANKSNPHKHKNNNNNSFAKNVLVKPYHWINHFNAIGDHTSPSTWSIYIYNIAPEVEELTLWQLFGPYGAIVSVKIIKDHQTNKSKGFGFVTMRNYDQAAMAIQALNGYVLHSQPLSDNNLWRLCFSVHSAALADVETPAATGGVGLTVSSKVYPSPGAARGVWALPQPPPCTMAAEEPLPPCSPISPDAPAAPPRAITSLYHHSDLHQLIFEAVRSGEVCEIERLVEKLGVEVLSARDQHGYTPAHWAALDGCVAVMRYLVERAAPVDLSCLGTQGPRPIHWACRKGHASVVQVLLQSGVAVNAADFKGLTPLMTACMYGKTATAAYLLGMGAATRLSDINGDTALHWAAYKGHADLVRLLIYSGVPLHCTDNFGSTPLHLACLSGNLTCVRLLCEKVKAELEPRDKNGKTPLMLAQSHRHAEVVKLLQKEMKRKSHWMPPLSELWALLFGGAGDSKGPLLFFLVSVLLWGYPMYVIRCIPLTWNTLRLSHYCFLYWNGIMWLSWVIANRRDPGYIPQNSETYYRAIRQIPYYDKWKKRNAILSRLCHTCRCLRPLRAKHCRICKRCVAYFDHHCPFIYNCVGVRNRMWFFLFVMSVAINCTLSIYFACYCLLLEGFGLLYVLGLLEAITFCALGWILTCTSILHACMNLTTNEMFNYKRYPYLRDKRGRYQNPFSRGPFMNLIEFFVCLPDKCDEQDIFHEESI